MEKEKFYITTPIYYPSDKLHIGHAYSTVAADTLARYKRLRGFDTFFLTGTDEHGQKIERKAKEAGKSPKDFTDDLVVWIEDLWKKLDISYDDFIRTTDKRHKKAVQTIFTKLLENDDIYLSKYEGLYCTPCESYFTEFQAKNGVCPDCERELEKVEEESYFLRISKYEKQLKEFYEKNPDWLKPSSRKNEFVENFLNKGLEDLSISRTTFDWGIKVPNDPKHVVYVWIDALANYWSAIGYGSDESVERYKFEKYFPADVHLIGKEIVRFHGIYLPVLHFALDLPLPGKLFAHGWLLINGGKMSKSKGNVVDPKFLIERYGSDTLRYFLLREVPFGQDGEYSNRRFLERIKSDLANKLSNLVHRTLPLIHNHFDSKVPSFNDVTDAEQAIIDFSKTTIKKVEESLDKFQFSIALTHVWEFISHMNKYFDESAVWNLAKTDKVKASIVLYHVIESIRIIGVLLQPFLPKTSDQIFQYIGINNDDLKSWDSSKTFGLYPSGTTVLPSVPIFKKVNIDEEIKILEK